MTLHRSVLASLLFVAFAVVIVSAPAGAQLGICPTTPQTSTEISGSLFTAPHWDAHVNASKTLCAVDLQDWPVAAERLNLSASTVLVVPQGTSDPVTCSDSPADLFFRTDTARLRYCSAPDTWSDLTTGTAGGLDQDGDGTEEVTADGSTVGIDSDDDATDEVSISSAGDVSAEGVLGLGSITLASAACIDNDGADRLYHDTNCDGVKDVGEEFIDLTGTSGGSASSLDFDSDGTSEVSSNGTTIFFDADEDGANEATIDSSRLSVKGDVLIQGPVDNAVIDLESNVNSHRWRMQSTDTSGAFLFRDTSAGQNSFVVENSTPTGTLYLNGNGTVGIGTSSPTSQLDVASGTARVIELDDGVNTVCFSLSGDRLYHDTDCDGVKDAGEEYIDQVGGGSANALYHPDREPATCNECEEWDGGADDLTGWTERNFGTSTSSYPDRGYEINPEASGTNARAYMRAVPSATDFVVSTKVAGRLDDDSGAGGLIMVVEGTEASPTRLYLCLASEGSLKVEMADYASYSSPTAAVGAINQFLDRGLTGTIAASPDYYVLDGLYLQMRWDNTTDVLSCHASWDGTYWHDVASKDLTADADAPVSHGVFAYANTGGDDTLTHFAYFRVRTDADGLAGEVGDE